MFVFVDYFMLISRDMSVIILVAVLHPCTVSCRYVTLPGTLSILGAGEIEYSTQIFIKQFSGKSVKV